MNVGRSSIRNLADYFRLAGLWGGGHGSMRYGPQSVLSNEVRRGMEAGQLKQRGDWEEWSSAMLKRRCQSFKPRSAMPRKKLKEMGSGTNPKAL